MNVLGISGCSGSGKTSLIIRLLHEFYQRGLRVSTLKHAHHDIDLDTPGKDSFRHRSAGAYEVMLVTGKRFALMHDFPAPEDSARTLMDLIARMAPVDLLLVEGFKKYPLPKLEVHRPLLGKPLLQPNDPSIVGIASPETLAAPVPVLALDDTMALADFVQAHACPVSSS